MHTSTQYSVVAAGATEIEVTPVAPVDHVIDVYVPVVDAFNVPDEPSQMVKSGTVTVGTGKTVIVTERLPVQAPPSVTVKGYVVVVDGHAVGFKLVGSLNPVAGDHDHDHPEPDTPVVACNTVHEP